MSKNLPNSNKNKEIILKSTYEGTGLFDELGNQINYNEINLSEDTVNKIKKWIGWYWDTFYNSDDFDSMSFYKDGIEIAIKIKKELGNEFKIIYDDREIILNENGDVFIEPTSVSKIINQIEKFLQNDELQNLVEEDETKEKIDKLKFISHFIEQPSISKIYDLEIKSLDNLDEEYINIFEDYCVQVFDYFETVNDFRFPNISRMRSIIEENYCDKDDMELNDDEFILEYLHYFKSQIDNTLNAFNEIYKTYKIEVGDPYESKVIFFNAYCSNYFFPLEDWTRILSISENEPEKLISELEKIRLAEKIVMEYHKNQPYGNHIQQDDYYKWHLNLVREQAKVIAKNESINTYRAEIVALLHDILEDTNYSAIELLNKFGKRVYDAVKLLTYKKGSSHKDYLKKISNNSLAKVVKAADRYVNITQLKDIKETEKREKLFFKYLRDYPLFLEYNIYPKYIEEAFRKLLI